MRRVNWPVVAALVVNACCWALIVQGAPDPALKRRRSPTGPGGGPAPC